MLNARYMITLLAMVFGTSAQSQPQIFYAGKQINLVAGSAAGGGYDLLARLTARHMGKHIPGKPSIVVQNMPAGGSLVAANYLANNAPRDGLTIALLQRGMLLIGLNKLPQVQFDISKFNWLGSLNSEVGVTLANASSEFLTTRDLFEKELVVGGVINVDPETTARLYNDLLGTKFKIVNGYNGTTEIGLAMERGELQGIADWSWSSFNAQQPHWLRDGKVKVLLQGSLNAPPELAHVPRALDFTKGPLERAVLELYFTQKTVARPFLTPPEVPSDRLATLRTAFNALMDDKEFHADAERSKLEVNLIDSVAVEKIVSLITSTNEGVRNRYVNATK